MENNNSFLTLFLAPVAAYLADDTVSEILINGHERVYIERNGKLEEIAERLADSTRTPARSAFESAKPLVLDPCDFRYLNV